MLASDYLTLADLADRWGVTADTARRYTRQGGFPAPLALSRRTLRWLAEEVLAWERERRSRRSDVAPARPSPRRTPPFLAGQLPPPARVR